MLIPAMLQATKSWHVPPIDHQVHSMIMVSLLGSCPEHGAYTNTKAHKYCISTIDNPPCCKAALSAVESIHNTTSTAADSTRLYTRQLQALPNSYQSHSLYTERKQAMTSSLKLQLTRKGHSSQHLPMHTHPRPQHYAHTPLLLTLLMSLLAKLLCKLQSISFTWQGSSLV